MKKVYLSGKIARLPEEEYKQNFAQAAMDALAFFPDEQVTIVNPATLPAIHNSWADYLLRDLMLLKDCDAIVMLPNWPQSKGAQTERWFALGAGIEVKYLPLRKDLPIKPCILDCKHAMWEGPNVFDYGCTHEKGCVNFDKFEEGEQRDE